VAAEVSVFKHRLRSNLMGCANLVPLPALPNPA
jgi:hypothetical protein